MILLEIGLVLLVLAVPLPFGAVGPAGRAALEIGALVLTALWSGLALTRPVALPPRGARFAIVALLGLAALQAIPLGHGIVGALSPRAEALRAGLDPEASATLSLAPGATASALRTGAALAGILLVTTSVVAERGATRLALAALVSAAFQGLYGLLVLASGHARIWNVAKTAYLDSATGTFVNKNHFAGFLAATIPLGIGLAVLTARKARAGVRRGSGFLLAFGPGGTRALFLVLLLLPALGGLLLSFSRAGIALGVLGAAVTAFLSISARPRTRVAAIVLVAAVAAVPLADLGIERLAGRYATSGSDLGATGGRGTVWLGTLAIVRAFPATGCGFGAFTWVFPAFSDPEVRLHYTHAHNDLLQLGAEGGIGAWILLGVMLGALAGAGRVALRNDPSPVVIGAAVGLAAILLHGLVDFDFHIPADAAIAAALAGVLFGAAWNARR